MSVMGIFVHQWDILMKDLIDLQYVRPNLWFLKPAFDINAKRYGYRYFTSEEPFTR